MNILTKFQLSSSNGLGGKGSHSQLINDEAVCRTAPTTQGLLIILANNRKSIGAKGTTSGGGVGLLLL